MRKKLTLFLMFLLLVLIPTSVTSNTCIEKLYMGTYPNGLVRVYDGSSWSTSFDSPEYLIWSLGFYNDELYAGTWINGQIYKYDGCDWELSYDTLQRDVKSFEEYNGKLYASSGASGKVYVYDGSSWKLEFDPPDIDDSYGYSLKVYNGKLYYGTGWNGGTIYVYDGSSWNVAYETNTGGVYALEVYNNKLYAGTGTEGKIYVYDGSSWSLAYDSTEEWIFSLKTYNGKLYAGTNPNGKIFVYDGISWSLSYDSPEDKVLALEVFDNKLYAATTPNGKVYSYNGISWSLAHDDDEQWLYSLKSACLPPCCGDGICEGDETVWTCCQDCGIPPSGCDPGDVKYWYTCDTGFEPTKHTYDCDDDDYYEDYEYYCSNDERRKHRMFHDFSCSAGECVEDADWTDDQLVEDCNDLNGWHDTGNTRWTDCLDNECQECEEKKQEYRDHYCEPLTCDNYDVTDTRWIETGNRRNKPDSTECGGTACKHCLSGVCTDMNCVEDTSGSYTCSDTKYCLSGSCVFKKDGGMDCSICGNIECKSDVCCYDNECMAEFNGCCVDDDCGTDSAGCLDSACSWTDYFCDDDKECDSTSGKVMCDDFSTAGCSNNVCEKNNYYCSLSTCQVGCSGSDCCSLSQDSVNCLSYNYCSDYGDLFCWEDPLATWHEYTCSPSRCTLSCSGEDCCSLSTDTVNCDINDIIGSWTCYNSSTRQRSGTDYFSEATCECSFLPHTEYETCPEDGCCLSGNCYPDGYCSNDEVCSHGYWITHCGDGIINCGEECEVDGDCANRCEDDVRYYDGICLDCSCSYSTENCDDLDGWYNTSDWYCVNSCKRCKDQQYRDYYCTPDSCEYTTGRSKTYCEFAPVGQHCMDGEWTSEGFCGSSSAYCFSSCEYAVDKYECDGEGHCDYFDYTETFNCPKDTSCYNGECSSDKECYTGNLECKDACTVGQQKFRCDGLGSCTEHWEWINIASCNPYSCVDGTCSSVCSQLCGAECDENSDCPDDGWTDYTCKTGNVKYREYRDYYCSGDCVCDYEVTDTESFDCDDLDGWYNTTDWVYYDCKRCKDQEYRNYYCSDGECAYSMTHTREYCEDINEGEVCDVSDYECKDACTKAKREYTCQSGACEFNQWINLQSCNPYTCSLGSCTLVCSETCGAECSEDGDCPEDSCSVRYYDYCEGKKLVEYDDDKKKDSTLVSDSVQNICLENCTCTDYKADCSPPVTNSYCVKGLCGAECDQDSHCRPFISDSYCEYGGYCDNDVCSCNYQYEEYCPLPGTTSDHTCYYGTRGCDDEGCQLDTCTLDPGCWCDPVDGCVCPTTTTTSTTTTSTTTTTILGPYCGDGSVDLGEQCELPGTNNNFYCSQTTSMCDYSLRHYCTRDSKGSCDSGCMCVEDPWNCGETDDSSYCYHCDHCGDSFINCNEECEQDSDCPEDGFYCSNSYTKQERDYYCSECDCDFDVLSSDDCRDNDVDSDSGKNFLEQGTCTDYTGCLDGECVDTNYTDYCLDDTLTEYYIHGMSCKSVTKDCNDFDSSEINETEETCDWEDYGCGTGKCYSLVNGSVDCDDYDFLTFDLDEDTCTWADKAVSSMTCTVGCEGESCCYDKESEDVDCDDYDLVSGSMALDYEVSETTCIIDCHDEACCELIINETCVPEKMCENVTVENETYWCDGEEWVTELPYCCYGDTKKPIFTHFQDDGNIYDDDETGYMVCAKISDECSLKHVKFSYKFFCYPWSEWYGYTEKFYDEYCFEVPREVWIQMVGRTIYWKVYAEDYSGNSRISSQQLGGRIYDDDDRGPSFSDSNYSRWVTYNESIPVEITITDPNGIDSVVLHYDYDYFTGEDGYDDSPSVVGDRYTFTIPAPCPGCTNKDECDCDYIRGNMKFWIIATDNDTDRPDDKSTSRFDSLSIYIDPPDEVRGNGVDNSIYIDSYSPLDSNVVMKEGSCKTFFVSVSDDVNYTWTLDGEEVSDEDNFYYCSDNGEAGSHEIKVVVSDGSTSDSHSWNVTVENELCEGESEQEPSNSGSDSGSSSSGSSGGSSVGGGGGSFRGSSVKEQTQEPTEEEPVKKSEEKPKITKAFKTETREEPETQETPEEKLAITGLLTFIDPKYLLLSFFITCLLIWSGVKIFNEKHNRK